MSKLATSILILGLAILSGCETGVREGDWDNPHDPNGSAYGRVLGPSSSRVIPSVLSA